MSLLIDDPRFGPLQDLTHSVLRDWRGNDPEFAGWSKGVSIGDLELRAGVFPEAFNGEKQTEASSAASRVGFLLLMAMSLEARKLLMAKTSGIRPSPVPDWCQLDAEVNPPDFSSLLARDAYWAYRRSADEENRRRICLECASFLELFIEMRLCDWDVEQDDILVKNSEVRQHLERTMAEGAVLLQGLDPLRDAVCKLLRVEEPQMCFSEDAMRDRRKFLMALGQLGFSVEDDAQQSSGSLDLENGGRLKFKLGAGATPCSLLSWEGITVTSYMPVQLVLAGQIHLEGREGIPSTANPLMSQEEIEAMFLKAAMG